MNSKRIFKFLKSLNIFIIIILGLLAFSVLYFFYHRQRSQAWVYVSLSLIRPANTSSNIPTNTVPYWVGNNIKIGDQENNLLGTIGAVVVDKESIDWHSFGQTVTLVLKINSTKDRTGVYLYKNKPLLIGGTIDLKLTKTQVQGLVTYIGKEQPKYETSQLFLTLKAKKIEPWNASSIIVGEELKNNKGDVVAKIIDKRVTPAEVRADTASGVATISYDRTMRDLVVLVMVVCQKVDDSCYFGHIQKIKVDETLYLPFKSNALTYPIISISQSTETSLP